MKRLLCSLVILSITLAPCAVHAQSGVMLLATTDLDCTWKLDGKPQGKLKAGDATTIAVSPGKHLVQAASTDGNDEWRTVFTITQAGQELVEIKLKDMRQRRLREEENAFQQRMTEEDLKEHPTWTDPATGLMWARQDNGSDVNRNQANNYCSNLRLGGYKNWRLPTMHELEGIYDKTQQHHIKGGIQLRELFSRIWSNEQGVLGEVFEFRSGQVAYGSSEDVSYQRALCVRRSGE